MSGHSSGMGHFSNNSTLTNACDTCCGISGSGGMGMHGFNSDYGVDDNLYAKLQAIYDAQNFRYMTRGIPAFVPTAMGVQWVANKDHFLPVAMGGGGMGGTTSQSCTYYKDGHMKRM